MSLEGEGGKEGKMKEGGRECGFGGGREGREERRRE